MNALDPLELAVLIEKKLISEHGLTEVVLCLRQQQAEIDEWKEQCFAFQNAAIDLAKKNSFLEDWQKTWSPYIKEAHGINTTILRKASEK